MKRFTNGFNWQVESVVSHSRKGRCGEADRGFEVKEGDSEELQSNRLRCGPNVAEVK